MMRCVSTLPQEMCVPDRALYSESATAHQTLMPEQMAGSSPCQVRWGIKSYSASEGAFVVVRRTGAKDYGAQHVQTSSRNAFLVSRVRRWISVRRDIKLNSEGTAALLV